MLLGPSNCGKTTTLTLVYQELLRQSFQSTHWVKEGDPADFSDVVTLNSRSISILTMGDVSARVLKGIHDADLQKYDVFITACNDRFLKPPRKIGLYPGSVVIHKIPQPTNLQAIDNQNLSQQIIGLL
jgi:hypothetical protein